MKDKCVASLIHAVMNNQITKVERLLKQGADPNGCEDFLMYSPLHYAAAHSGVEIAVLLLKAGADLTAKDCDGNTPLDMAWLHHNKAFIALCSRQQQYGGTQTIKKLKEIAHENRSK